MILLAQLFGLLLPWLCFAQVQSVISSTEIAIPLQSGRCWPGEMVAIFSQEGDREPLGFAEIQGFWRNESECRAKVTSHSRSGLIRPGDREVLLNLEEQNDFLKGRYDLLRQGNKKTAARYKPLVYGGYLFGQTAATLDNNEFLMGLTPFMFGISDELQVDATPVLLAADQGQVGIKYKFLDLEDVKLSARLQGTRYFNIGKGAWVAELFYDSTSNSRSMSHTRLRFSSKLPDSSALQNRDKEKAVSVEISSVYEWILPSWHRILLGPKFTAGEEKDVGITFAFLLVYRRFHASLNLEINSLAKLDLRQYKQVPSFDLYWRF